MNSRFLFASPWVEMVLLRYIPPAPIVSANDIFLLRFTYIRRFECATLFHWEGVSRCHVLSAPPLLEFTSWARTRANHV